MRPWPLELADACFAALVMAILVHRARRQGRGAFAALVAGNVSRQLVWRRMAIAEVMLLALTLAYLLGTGWVPADFGARMPHHREMVLGSVTLGLSILAVGARQARSRRIPTRDLTTRNGLDGTVVAAALAPRSLTEWGQWAGVCLATSAAEELFFRGFLFNLLRSHTSTWAGIAASSVLFGLVHAQYVIRQRLGLALTGFVFGGFYLLGGGLLFPIAVHTLLNLVTVANAKRSRQVDPGKASP